MKNPMKKKSTLKVEEEEKKKSTGRIRRKNSTNRADGLFRITSVKQYTPKK